MTAASLCGMQRPGFRRPQTKDEVRRLQRLALIRRRQMHLQRQRQRQLVTKEKDHG